jgi:phage gp36-like protein
MSYAVEADMQTHFGAAEVLIAADRNGDGIADSGVIIDSLADSSAEIDSYLAVRYTLPLASVPSVLVRVCCEITMYRISINGPSMTEEKRVRYEDAVKWLTNLSKGIVTIGVGEDTATVNDVATVAGTNSPRLFTRATMTGLM